MEMTKNTIKNYFDNFQKYCKQGTFYLMLIDIKKVCGEVIKINV